LLLLNFAFSFASTAFALCGVACALSQLSCCLPCEINDTHKSNVNGIDCGVCCVGVTQQLIDETRLTPENEMLEDVKAMLADGGDAGWRGCFGETLVPARCIVE